MKSIFGILLATLLTVAPSTAWSQPALSYRSGVGAGTDISGGVYDPGIMVTGANGNLVSLCPPTMTYGRFGGGGQPPQQTGGDGVWSTMDAKPLNTGGRTEMSYAYANAKGYARAIATVDTSPPCHVSQDGSIFMSAYGLAISQFYRRFTVVGDPSASPIDLEWSLEGSFSSLTSSRGGLAEMVVYLLTNPPPYAVPGNPTVISKGALQLIFHNVTSLTGTANFGWCGVTFCPPVAKASLAGTNGTIDLRTAFQIASGRPIKDGDLFVIGVILRSDTVTCAPPDKFSHLGACNLLTAFTTDFEAMARVRSAIVVAGQ